MPTCERTFGDEYSRAEVGDAVAKLADGVAKLADQARDAVEPQCLNGGNEAGKVAFVLQLA